MISKPISPSPLSLPLLVVLARRESLPLLEGQVICLQVPSAPKRSHQGSFLSKYRAHRFKLKKERKETPFRVCFALEVLTDCPKVMVKDAIPICERGNKLSRVDSNRHTKDPLCLPKSKVNTNVTEVTMRCFLFYLCIYFLATLGLHCCTLVFTKLRQAGATL